jgi:hypothetical protein
VVSFPFPHLRLGFLPKHWCPYFSTYLTKVNITDCGLQEAFQQKRLAIKKAVEENFNR